MPDDGAREPDGTAADSIAAYNSQMFQALTSTLAPAALERLTLLCNHVLGQEAVAMQRLKAHAGKSVRIRLTGWPTPLPMPTGLVWTISPAGLLEWTGGDADRPVELELSVPANDLVGLSLQAMTRSRPAVDVSGDAQLAADVDWLLQNLRWDAAADLERVFPAPVAAVLQRVGAALALGLRGAAQGLATVRERWQARQGS